jgi:midasin
VQEPVLLVGETGNGKTTVCQLYSMLLAQQLHILNCHQHTETSDFLGGLRPVRSKHKIKAELVDRVNACSKWHKSIAQVTVDQDVEEIMQIVQDLPNQVNHKIKRDAKFLSEMKEMQEMYRHIKSLFIWYDGPLVQAMKNGDLFLIDEISLAGMYLRISGI